MKKYILPVFVLLVNVLHSGTQAAALPQTPDSLAALLRQSTLPDTMRVKALSSLAGMRRQTDLAEARRLGEEGLALARRIHFLGGELSCLIGLSNAAASARQYVQAEQLAQQAVQRSETAPPRLLYYRAMALQALGGISSYLAGQKLPAGRAATTGRPWPWPSSCARPSPRC